MAQTLTTTGNRSIDLLPDDLMLDIFLRLQVKTLKRLSCVCKSWCSTFQNPNFISSYNRNNNFVNCYVQFFTSCRHTIRQADSHLCSLSNETMQVDQWFSQYFSNRQLRISECEGLICMYDIYDVTSVVVLLNPATRQFKCLPQSHTRINGVKVVKVMGLGYDSITDDYKIIQFISNNLGVQNHHCNYIHRVEVYSLSNNSWKQIPCPLNNKQCLLHHIDVSTYFNGCCHWWMVEGNAAYILAFDASQETFQTMLFRADNFYIEISCYKAYHHLRLRIFDNHLAVIELSKEVGYYDIWVMKDYGNSESWIKEVVTAGLSFGFYEIQGMWIDGEWFLNTNRKGVLKLYDPNTKVLKSYVDLLEACRKGMPSKHIRIDALKVFIGRENLLPLNNT